MGEAIRAPLPPCRGTVGEALGAQGASAPADVPHGLGRLECAAGDDSASAAVMGLMGTYCSAQVATDTREHMLLLALLLACVTP